MTDFFYFPWIGYSLLALLTALVIIYLIPRID